MQYSRSLTLLAASLQAAAAFQFTGPSTDDTLDLSGPITITWERGSDSSDASDYEQFNLFFYGSTAEDETRFSWTLQTNITNEDGSFEWDPIPALEVNQEQEEPHTFSEGRDYYFYAQFLGEDGEAGEGTSISSARYEIENYELSAAGRTAVTPLLALAGLIPVVYHFL